MVCKTCKAKKDCLDYIHQVKIEKGNLRFAETKTCEFDTNNSFFDRWSYVIKNKRR